MKRLGGSAYLTQSITYIHRPDMDCSLTVTPRVIDVSPGWVDVDFLTKLAGEDFVRECVERGVLVDDKPERM